MGLYGGALTLGAESPYHSGNYSYVPIVNDTYYVVGLNSISVGEVEIISPADGYANPIVDSGTTQLVIPQEAYDRFTDALQSKGGLKGLSNLLNPNVGICTIVRLSSGDIGEYPPITVDLSSPSNPSGLKLVIPPHSYILSCGIPYLWKLGVSPMDSELILGGLHVGFCFDL